ncbi:hypothetical protein Gotur_017867 [Gossypium turneri]
MHDIPPRFFSKVLARHLGHFIGHFVEYDGESIARGLRSSMRIKIFMDIHLPLKKKKGLLFSPENIGYVHFKYERLTLFCLFCGKLGHSDSFSEERMSLGFEVPEMGDPSLISKETSQEHDSEEVVLEGEEGKKCPRQTLGENHTTLAKGGVEKITESIRMLLHVLKLDNPQIVFFIETKINKVRMEKVKHLYGFLNGIEVAAEGSRGGLCLAWKGNVTISLKSFSISHVDMEVEKDDEGGVMGLTLAFGSGSINSLKCIKRMSAIRFRLFRGMAHIGEEKFTENKHPRKAR